MTKKANLKQFEEGIEDVVHNRVNYSDTPTTVNPADIGLVKGSYTDKTVMSVIELPRNQIKPVNRLIFAIEQDPGEMKTSGGVIVPTDFSMPEAKRGVERKLRRYYVVDVADDVDLQVNGRKLSRGDEILPFIPQDAEDWTFVEVYDFYIRRKYFVFEQLEICAIGMSPSLTKEGE